VVIALRYRFDLTMQPTTISSVTTQTSRSVSWGHERHFYCATQIYSAY